MSDQAVKLRLLAGDVSPAVNDLTGGLPVVVVTGGRAGVGVTTLAINLAVVLADRGERVLVVDVAREGKSLSDVAGVKSSKVEFALADVIAGSCTAAKAIVPGPAGTTLLASRGKGSWRCGRESRLDSPADADNSRNAQQRLLAELQSLRGDFDWMVIDIGSVLNAWTRRFWLQARLVLMVTTADGTALMDSYAAIKRSVADGLGPDVRLVVNQCDDDGVIADAHRRLSSACRRFLGCTVPVMPSLPFCAADGATGALPHIWETPDTPFGHAMLWLGRAVGDLLSTPASISTSADSRNPERIAC